MSFPPGRMALPWPLLLLLLDFQLLITPVLCRQEQNKMGNQNAMSVFFPPTLEFALYMFNLHSKDEYAYKEMRVLSAKREQVAFPMIFSMKLKLGRTKCRKFEEDIDNCPFQDSPELKNTFTCFFTIGTTPENMMFTHMKDLCLEQFP